MKNSVISQKSSSILGFVLASFISVNTNAEITENNTNRNLTVASEEIKQQPKQGRYHKSKLHINTATSETGSEQVRLHSGSRYYKSTPYKESSTMKNKEIGTNKRRAYMHR